MEHASGYEMASLADVKGYSDEKLKRLREIMLEDKLVNSMLPETEFNLGYYSALRRYIAAITQMIDEDSSPTGGPATQEEE